MSAATLRRAAILWLATATSQAPPGNVLSELGLSPIGRTTVHSPESAFDGDEGTEMVVTHLRSCRPGICGMEVETRAAVKITRITFIEDTQDFLRSGRIVAMKGGRPQVVATFQGSTSGTNEINLWPPLKIAHNPFVFRIETDHQNQDWRLKEMKVYSATAVPRPPPKPTPAAAPPTQPRVRVSDARDGPSGQFRQPDGSTVAGQGNQWMPPRPPKQQPAAPSEKAVPKNWGLRQPRPIVCVPECVHGACEGLVAPAQPLLPAGQPNDSQPQLGSCTCEEGYHGNDCAGVRCGKCASGKCITPDVCSCDAGWSGAGCGVPGSVKYGMSWIKIRSGNRKDDMLFSAVEMRSAVSTSQAVINWKHPSPEDHRNWWQVLGPRGTSESFLYGHDVPADATIQLRHVSSGSLLRGDASQPALARPDLREVSCLRNDSAPTGDEEWTIQVNGSALGRLVWGLGSPVSIHHRRSSLMLTCSGQTYHAKNQESIFGKKLAPVYETQLQEEVPSAGSQRWYVAEHRAVPTLAAEPVGLHSVVRIASANASCYLQQHLPGSGPTATAAVLASLGCEADGGISSFWVVLSAAPDDSKTTEHTTADAEQQILLALDAFAQAKEAELSEIKLWKLMARAEEEVGVSEEQLEGLSKQNIVSLLVDKMKIVHRKQLDEAEAVRPKPVTRARFQHVLTSSPLLETATASPNASIEAASCIEVVSPGQKDAWLAGDSVALTFCMSNSSIGGSIGVGGSFVAEVVGQAPKSASAVDLHAMLAELCLTHRSYSAAVSHFSEAIDSFVPTRRERFKKRRSGFSSKHLLLFKRARAHMLLGHPMAAVGDLETAINEAPNFSEANLYHARIAISLGRWQAANASLHSILSLSATDTKLQYKASLYMSKINQSMQVLDEATSALDVSDEAFGNGAARCEISDADRGVLRWTRTQFTDLLEVAPESVTMRLQRAKANLLLGDTGSAKSDATWAIRLSKHNPNGFLLRGLAHLYTFDHKGALGYFKWCVKVDMEHAACKKAVKAMKTRKAHAANATATFKAGQFDLALAHYGAMIEAMPGHCLHTALMRLQRCRCLIYLDRPAIAKGECLEALRLDPELKDAELLARDADSIARDYQTWSAEELKRRANAEKKKKAEAEKKLKAEEEKKIEEEREKAKEEAEAEGKQYVDPHPESNETNATAMDRRRMRDWDEERKISTATICEGHYFRLNMSSYKTRQRRCSFPVLKNNQTLCEKLRGCHWNAIQAVENSSGSWAESFDEESSGDCVAKEVTVSDVKRSYRRLAMVWHPDKKHRPKAKARAESVFPVIVASYEIMSDERQIQLCNSGDAKKTGSKQQQQQQQQQHQQKQKEHEEQKKQEKQEPPKAKPKAGRSQSEPPKQDPPTYASMDWNVKSNVGGLLEESSSTEPPDKSASAGIRYSFALQFTPKTDGRQNGKMLSMVDLDAFGHPERKIHWQSAAWGQESGAGGGFEEFRRKFGVKDEYGKHTAGETGSAGWGGGDGRTEKPWFIPAVGSLKLFFNAQRGGDDATYNTLTEEQWVFALEAREYDFTDLMPADAKAGDLTKGIAVLRLMVDDREGPVDIFIGLAHVASLDQGRKLLRLDSVTAVFSEEYWTKKTSLTRKVGLLMEGTLEEASGSNVHHAVDGDRETIFMSAGPLMADDALALDLQMIYHFSKIKLAEEVGRECQTCVVEVSVDQLWWWPIHNFRQGVGEEIEFRSRAGVDADVTTAGEFPVIGRYVRIRQTQDEWRQHQPAWAISEFEVFGDELGESVASDAAIWFEGDTLRGSDDAPLSAVLDSDMDTSFVSTTAPAGEMAADAIVIDLQHPYRLALVAIWQNPLLACQPECVMQGSKDGEGWIEIQQMAHIDGMVIAGFGPDDGLVARYIRLAVIQPMQTVWEILDLEVHGVVVEVSEAEL